jgi:hypothetical protein
MSHDLSPEAVAARLRELQAAWIAEDEHSARARLEPSRPRSSNTFDEEVSGRLAELRALLELTAHLHSAR